MRGTHKLERAPEWTGQSTEERNQERGTHSLEPAAEKRSENTGRMGPREGHSPTTDRIGRNVSGHRKKATDRMALTN